jgi:hypothetical protein
MSKARLIIFLVATALAVFLFSVCKNRNAREEELIRARYQQMRAAMSSKNTNSIKALFAPAFQSSVNDYHITMLNDFAQPLGSLSSILVIGDEALIWPTRVNRYLVIPGGNTIEMIKVNTNWYFTGKIHID